MMTKTAFFALLKDKENRLNPTAHIAFFEEANGNKSVIVRQQSAPNFGLSMHRSDATAQAAFTKYNAWLNEWLVARTAEAQARIDQIESDHAEALEMNIQIKNQRIVADAYRQPVNQRLVELAHAEALKMDVIHDNAIALIAENISLPVWEGSRDAIKAQLRKFWGDNAPAYTNTAHTGESS